MTYTQCTPFGPDRTPERLCLMWQRWPECGVASMSGWMTMVAADPGREFDGVGPPQIDTHYPTVLATWEAGRWSVWAYGPGGREAFLDSVHELDKDDVEQVVADCRARIDREFPVETGRS